MKPTAVRKDNFLNSLPPVPQAERLAAIRWRVAAAGRKIVVLDDDPTGTQTVHAVPVLTYWDTATLVDELRGPHSCFYILTNSRSMPPQEAHALNLRIGQALNEAAAITDRECVVVSRSDSTLRGHFPTELLALEVGLKRNFDAWLIVPFFLEGGRFTVNQIHYVEEDGQLVPAGETAFARDAAFGYRASDLRYWVQEKTGGRVQADQVKTISIEDLRVAGPAHVCEQLLGLRDNSVCVVDAAAYADVEILVESLLDAEAQGKDFLYRTAASFVRIRAGIEARPLIADHEVVTPGTGGLMIVGSYVPQTTAQLRKLIAVDGVDSIHIDVSLLLDDSARAAEIAAVIEHADGLLRKGRDVVISTSRAYVAGDNAAHSLMIGQQISDGLVSIVQGIKTRPRYLIAKGGITASDLATRALAVRRAVVAGQILPGVPVWKLGEESRFPDMAYIVFPGNVGSESALADIVMSLRQAHKSC